MTSKLHGICDSKGGPLRLHRSEGQGSDFTDADVLRKHLPPTATVMGDQGYNRDKIRKMLSQQVIPPCIPPVAAARNQSLTARECSVGVTKSRIFFSRQRDWRPIATRYDRWPTSSVLPLLLAPIAA